MAQPALFADGAFAPLPPIIDRMFTGRAGARAEPLELGEQLADAVHQRRPAPILEHVRRIAQKIATRMAERRREPHVRGVLGEISDGMVGITLLFDARSHGVAGLKQTEKTRVGARMPRDELVQRRRPGTVIEGKLVFYPRDSIGPPKRRILASKPLLVVVRVGLTGVSAQERGIGLACHVQPADRLAGEQKRPRGAQLLHLRPTVRGCHGRTSPVPRSSAILYFTSPHWLAVRPS